MYVVIMAGGGGTRLRPVSTPERPKPFLPLLPTGETLLQRTARRLQGPELGVVDMFVVAAGAYAPLIESQLPGARVVVEPEGRNTAAAIALATLAIDRDEDEAMIVLPADHRIDPDREGVFRTVLRTAASEIATGRFGIMDPLVTLGVQVTRPATEYGYLLPDTEGLCTVEGLDAYPLRAFEEKPTRARADVLRGMPGVAWNAGMFVWRRRAIRAALEASAPDVLATIDRGLASGDLAAAYATLSARSIDYEVMEPAAAAGRVVMGSMDVGWTDVGTWPVLLEVLGASGIDGAVVEAGETVKTFDDDLVVDRTPAGLSVLGASDGTMTPERPVALLRSARAAEPRVQELLDRCVAAEAHA